jgi:hypothetical protein
MTTTITDKQSFIFYRSFFEATIPLSDEEKLSLFNAICEYGLNQNETELKPIAKAMFSLIKPQLMANQRRYENGNKGGRPKNQNETEEEPNNNLEQTKAKANKNDNVNVNDNKNDNYISLYSEILNKPVLKVSDKRKTALRKFAKSYSLDDFQEGLEKVKQSDFLREKKFCGFDWIINENNFIKIMEGNYENSSGDFNGNVGKGNNGRKSNTEQALDGIRAIAEKYGN